jgi:hypothetical protein
MRAQRRPGRSMTHYMRMRSTAPRYSSCLRVLATCNWLPLTSHPAIGDLAANTYANVLAFNRARRMVRCFHE